MDQHIFVGMKGNRVWRLLNKDTKKELLSTDVKFTEYLFPKLSDVTDETIVSVPQTRIRADRACQTSPLLLRVIRQTHK